MTLVDVALDCTRRGWYVFPCVPRSKRPLGGLVPNGVLDASNNLDQIRKWWTAKPDANVAIACRPSKLCVIDFDHGLTSVADLRRWMAAHGILNSYSVRTGRRPEFGVQLYYSGEGLKSTGWERDGVKGDIRCSTGYVMAAGSVHPDSGEVYEVLWDNPLEPVPEFVRMLTAKADDLSLTTTVDDETADEWKTWLLDYTDRNKIGSRDYEKRAPNGYWLGIVCPWEDQHGSGAGGESSTVLGILDGKIAFECSHGTCKANKRDTATFKQLMTLMHNEAAREPGADPIITIGGSEPKVEPANLPERVRPEYPISAWEGTVVAEFAKLCANDNNVPRKMYAESFRCVLGAVVGDRVCCPGVEGALPRTYTIIVAPKGKGKGTAIRRAVDFFSEPSTGAMVSVSTGLRVSANSGLLCGARDFLWKPKGIGAWMAAASSVPGMAKLTKDLDSTIKNKPEMTWGNTMPRILSVHEEMKTFLSTLFIEGGVGSGMEGVVCQLWDATNFHGTATGTRDAVYGEMLFSMLCGITEQDWFDLLSRGNAVGGGLMSRLNLIGTEGQFLSVSKMKPPDFHVLRDTFLPRIMQLEDAHVHLLTSDAADSIIGDWVNELPPEGSERMNIQVWRSALILAWLRHEDFITAKTAEDAVRLGQYQRASHEYYRPRTADTANARVQAKILRVLEMKGPLSKRDLKKYTNSGRDGTELWTRALDGLARDQSIGKREDGVYYLAG